MLTPLTHCFGKAKDSARRLVVLLWKKPKSSSKHYA